MDSKLTQLLEENERLKAQLQDATSSRSTCNNSQAVIDELERYKQIVEISPIPTLIVDPNFKIDLMNRKFTEVFGYTLDDVGCVEEWWPRAYPDESYCLQVQEEWGEKVTKALEQGLNEMEPMEVKVHCKDGTYQHVEARMAIVVGYNVVTFIDQTLQYQAREQEERARIAAEEANRAKSIFLANMSHEIRTPMNTILGFSEVLSEKLTDSDALKNLATIQKSGHNLMGLINDILDLSKVESGKIELLSESMCPHEVLGEMEELFSLKAQEKGLRLKINVDYSVPDVLVLDAPRLRQVLINLVGNAIKFTDAGSIRLDAYAVNTTPKQVDLVINVEDTGIGIPEEFQEHVFEAFSQNPGQNQGKYGGTGLGLAICQRLIQLMDGEIKLSSKESQGSVFSIHIPRVKIGYMSDLQREESLSIPEKITFDPAKILVVDDVDINRDLIRSFLNYSGLEFIEASDGVEAVAVAKSEIPDLILMDIKMPNMDGCEASTLIKQHDSTKEIPIVAITASAMKEQETQIRSLGLRFLRKPISKSILVNEILQYLSYQAHDEVGQTDEHELSQKISKENVSAIIADQETLGEKLPQYEAECEELIHALVLDEIESYAEKLDALADEHSVADLKEFSNQLKEQVNQFEIDEIPATLDKIKEFIQFLRQIIE